MMMGELQNRLKNRKKRRINQNKEYCK